MKKLIFSFKILSLVLFIGLIASCNKENSDLQFTEDEMLNENFDFSMEDVTYSFAEMDQDQDLPDSPDATAEDGKPKCFTFVFPVEIMFPDSSVVTVNNREEFRNAVKTWRENNPDIQGRPMIVFPVDVTLKNGEVVTINSKEEFRKLIIKCKKHFKHPRFKKCFKPEFPLTLVFPDETTLEVNSPQEMKDAIIEWRQNNPDAQGHPVIQFPFDVKLINGKTVTINNKEDLKRLLRKCRSIRKHHRKNKG
jgi:hypothetical protein